MRLPGLSFVLGVVMITLRCESAVESWRDSMSPAKMPRDVTICPSDMWPTAARFAKPVVESPKPSADVLRWRRLMVHFQWNGFLASNQDVLWHAPRWDDPLHRDGRVFWRRLFGLWRHPPNNWARLMEDVGKSLIERAKEPVFHIPKGSKRVVLEDVTIYVRQSHWSVPRMLPWLLTQEQFEALSVAYDVEMERGAPGPRDPDDIPY